MSSWLAGRSVGVAQQDGLLILALENFRVASQVVKRITACSEPSFFCVSIPLLFSRTDWDICGS